MRRRPKRSASHPPTNTSAAPGTVAAVRLHWSDPDPRWNAWAIDGAAVITLVAAITVNRNAVQSTTKATNRRPRMPADAVSETVPRAASVVSSRSSGSPTTTFVASY